MDPNKGDGKGQGNKPGRKLKEEMLKGMDLLKHGRDGKRRRKKQEKERKGGFLETGLQRLARIWNEQRPDGAGKTDSR